MSYFGGDVQTSQSTAAWTSATSLNTTLSLSVTNFAAVAISFIGSGTISSGVITLEVSDDGTNWFAVPAYRVGSETSESTYILTGANQAWTYPVAGASNFRVRLSTVITGSGTATVGLTATTAPSSPSVVSIGSALPTGSNVVGAVTQSAGPWSSNVTQVAGSSVSTAGTGIQKIGLSDGSGNAITSTSSALDVNIKSGEFSVVDEAAWTAGTSALTPVGGVFNDSATALTSGQEGTLRATNNRALHSNLRNAAGTEVGTASTPVQVSLANTASNATAVSVSGTVTTTPPSNASTNVSQIGGATVALGQTTMASSVPVAIASNQSAVPVSGTVTSNAGTGTLNVSQQAAVGTTGTLQNAVSATGNGSLLTVTGMSACVFTVTGTFTATVFFEGTQDGTNWSALSATQLGTNSIVTSATAAGVFECAVAGLTSVRARAAWTSGTSVTVTAETTPVPFSTRVVNANVQGTVPVSGTVTVQQSTASSLKVDLSGTAANTTAIKVDGSAVTQPVSAASLPLPSGASTSSKQPALGTAGSASVDVITVQGVASMTALKVDGSAVTQPVSGTVTANAGTGTFTTQQSNVTSDYDTGAGTQTLTMFGVALPASGGAVAGGTSTNPIRVDTTGTTTQPVSGTLSITANSSVNVAQIAGTTTDANSGVKSAGTQRIVIATDQPQLTNALKVDGSAVTQPVSASSLPLPTGASTSAKQPALGAAGTAASDVITVQGIASMTALKVDGSSVTQPVSGTVNVGSATIPASTTMQNAVTASGNGTSLPVAGYGTAVLNVTASVAMSGGTTINFEVSVDNTTWTSVQAISVGTNTVATTTTTTGDFQIDVAGYTSLRARISAYSAGTITVKGYTLLEASSPRVLNANVIGTVPVSGTFWQATQPVSGTVTVQQSTASSLKVDLSGTSANATAVKVDNSAVTQPVSGTVTVQQSTAASLKVDLSGTAANATAIKVDGSAATQPVSGTVTANAGTGTFNTQQSNITTDYDTGAGTQTMTMFGIALPASGGSVAGGTSTNPVQVSLANTGANSTAVKVDNSAVTQPVSGTFWQATQPVSAASLPLPTGASTAAKQPALGTAGSASADVITVQGVTSMTALKVDGSGVTQPVSGTFWQATQPVSGTVTANAGTGTFNIQANASVNVSQISGSTVSTAATGVQKVGIVGNAGATVDSTVGAGTAPTNAVITGLVYNSAVPAPTTGQALALQADQAGNLRSFNGMPVGTLTAWTSATALNATQNVFTNTGAEAVLVQLVQTTTLSAGAVTFDVTFDGTNWVTVPANCVLDPTSTTYAQIAVPYTVQASTNKAFLIASNGWQGLRVKLSTQITGSGSVTPNYTLLPFSPLDAVIALSPTASNFNATVNVAQVSGTTADTNSGNKSAGTQRVVLATDQPSLTNALSVSQSGTWTVQPGNTANSTAWLVQGVTGTSGGWSVSSQTGLTNTKIAVKASAGNFGGYIINNPNAVTIYIQVFDVASASVTLGTTTPTYVIAIPSTASANVEFSRGITHATAITLAATTTATGLTAPTTVLCATFLYK